MTQQELPFWDFERQLRNPHLTMRERLRLIQSQAAWAAWHRRTRWSLARQAELASTARAVTGASRHA